MQAQFAATLDANDVKHHIPHSFEVPASCRRLFIRFHFDPRRVDGVRNMLTLTLFDPHGFRGAGHRQGNTHEVELTPGSATPGYYPGVLPSGEWTVQIDTHMIMPGPPCRYKLEVTAETGGPVAQAPGRAPIGARPDFDHVVNAGAGWYRGDLHAHTVHSDAAWDVDALVDTARVIGLDFVTLTDHNTTSALPAMAACSAGDLLTMGGMELTTFWGHAVCLGADSWVDWRVGSDGEEMAQIATAQYAAGNLFIIAHPGDEGDPKCTGCRWVYPHMMPGPARFVEIWNGLWGEPVTDAKNEQSLRLWYTWLNEGHRLVATAGTDAHGPAVRHAQPGFNVVYAPSLSQQGILDGLKSGRVYLSSGPTLDFWAETMNGERTEIGGLLSSQGDGKGILHATWEDAPAQSHLRLVGNGEVQQEDVVDGDGSMTWTVQAGPDRWHVLELRQADGRMAAITNPIFFG